MRGGDVVCQTLWAEGKKGLPGFAAAADESLRDGFGKNRRKVSLWSDDQVSDERALFPLDVGDAAGVRQ